MPADFAGSLHRSLSLSAAERAAVDRANMLAAKRNAPGSTAIDRGFGPAIATRRMP